MNIIQTGYFILNHGIQSYIRKFPYICPALSKPTRVNMYVTQSCNLKCKQCDVPNSKITKEMSTDEIKNVISDLKKWLGPFQLTFSGGEPLIRKKVNDLIKFASERGVMTDLITNGTLLDKKTVDLLSNSKLGLLTVSLDGIKGPTHDYIRGVRGTHNKVIKNLEYAKKKLRTRILTILFNKNINEIPLLIKWAKNNNLYGIEFQPLQHNFRKKYEPLWYMTSELWPKDIKKLSHIIDTVIKMKNSGYPILNTTNHLKIMKEYYKNPQNISKTVCTAGVKNFTILHDGRVYICRFSLGNVRNENIHSIWNSKERLKIQDFKKNCRRECAILNCNIKKHFTDEVYHFFVYKMRHI